MRRVAPGRGFAGHGLLSALLTLIAALPSSPALAQPQEPIGGFVIDARGAIPFYPANEQVAASLDTTADRLPRYGLGFEVGGHVYPFRWKAVTFGFGASLSMSRGGRTPDTPEGAEEPAGPTVNTRLQGIAPQVSLNFGHRLGWSYLSAGYGTATYRTWRDDLPEDEGQSTSALNYGGGARWFVNNHLAVSLDLRFYLLASQAATDTTAGHPGMMIIVATAGVAIR